ncbi:hypothetical protein LguiA_030685 [Lonicera macranthoides]
MSIFLRNKFPLDEMALCTTFHKKCTVFGSALACQMHLQKDGLGEKEDEASLQTSAPNKFKATA